MASYVFYPGDGVQTDWPVPFPYLAKGHLKTLVDGEQVDFSWLNSALVRVTPPVPAGKMLLVKRETQDAPMTQFENTNNLTAENLTLAEAQVLFLAQEARDRAAMSITVSDATGQFDFNGRRANNVGDPVDPQDAATKHWAETSMSSHVAQALAAKNASVAAQGASEGARDTSITKAGEASASASAAAADRVQTGLDRAAVAGDRGAVASDKATVAADKATVLAAKGDALGARDVAVAAKDTAVAKASEAATSAANAHTSELNAAESAAEAAASAASVDGPNLLTKTGNLNGIADKAVARANIGAANKAGDTFTGPVNVNGVLSATTGDIRAYGYYGNNNAGIVFLNQTGDRYLWHDGTNYIIPGGRIHNVGYGWLASEGWVGANFASGSRTVDAGGFDINNGEAWNHSIWGAVTYGFQSWAGGFHVWCRYIQEFKNGNWYTIGWA